MRFEMSSAVAVQADDPEAARAFYTYTHVLGFPLRHAGGEPAIDASPLTLRRQLASSASSASSREKSIS